MKRTIYPRCAFTGGVRSGSVPGAGNRVPRQFHGTCSCTGNVLQQLPLEQCNANGGQMGHGGPAAQAGDAERANDAESEYDVHVPKPTGEAVLNEEVCDGIGNGVLNKIWMMQSSTGQC